jgi:hypothetical protein
VLNTKISVIDAAIFILVDNGAVIIDTVVVIVELNCICVVRLTLDEVDVLAILSSCAACSIPVEVIGLELIEWNPSIVSRLNS